ncbi:hypothetical protein [Polaromonas sp.]|nr:hypothetical protein [Polaromonas sp.]
MKRWVKWALAFLVLALLAAGVLRTLATRKAQQQAVLTENSARATGA